MEFATKSAEQPAPPVFVFCNWQLGAGRREGVNPDLRLDKVNAVPNGRISEPPSFLVIQDS